MARMIPNSYVSHNDGRIHEAEKLVYDALKKGPDEWTVLWSMHNKKITNCNSNVAKIGETDFVIMAPNLGVFILEVKGGGIYHDQRKWWSRGKNGEAEIHDPFLQAENNLNNIKQLLKNKKTYLDYYVNGYGVVFPNCFFDLSGTQHDKEIIYSRINSDTRKETIVDFINNLAKYWTPLNPKWKKPDDNLIQNMLNILIGFFDYKVTESEKIFVMQDERTKLIEEQSRAFVDYRYNDRLVVRGGGGTGKTVMALKQVRESINEGKKVGFFCYNIRLAIKLREEMGADIGESMVDSLTEYMDRIIAGQQLVDIVEKSKDTNNYYQNILPELFLEYIKEHPVKFDLLVLDEAQDLLRPKYLKVLDEMVEGGLENGHWTFYCDFVHQNIFNTEINYERFCNMMKEDYNAFFAVHMLTVNCRNTPAVQIELNKLIGSTETTLCEKLDENYYPMFAKIPYDSQEEGVSRLENCIKNLLEVEKIEPKNITILSPHRKSNSLAGDVKGFDLDLDVDSEDKIRFCTISGYKGLENDVVIMTDIDEEIEKKLLYTGISRTRGSLYIFTDESEKTQGYMGKMKKFLKQTSFDNLIIPYIKKYGRLIFFDLVTTNNTKGSQIIAFSAVEANIDPQYNKVRYQRKEFFARLADNERLSDDVQQATGFTPRYLSSIGLQEDTFANEVTNFLYDTPSLIVSYDAQIKLHYLDKMLSKRGNEELMRNAKYVDLKSIHYERNHDIEYGLDNLANVYKAGLETTEDDKINCTLINAILTLQVFYTILREEDNIEDEFINQFTIKEGETRFGNAISGIQYLTIES